MQVSIVNLGQVDQRWIQNGLGVVECQPESASLIDPAGRLMVRPTLRAYNGGPGGHRVLVITSRDLYMRGCGRLFGFSDRARGVAVVSTYHLRSDCVDAGKARLANVIAHELAHLDGLKHCRTPGCLMHPAQSAADIDGRAQQACGKCPRAGHGTLRAALGALAVCALLFAGLDQIGRLLKAPRNPFVCAAVSPQGTPYVLFDGHPVLAEHLTGERRPIPCRSASTAWILNRLFQDLDPPELGVVRSEPGRAAVRLGPSDLLEVLPGDAAGGDPALLAMRWATEIQDLLRGKGTASEVCPDCHLYRADEVEQTARKRRRI
jgi:hypothetical protein